MQSKTCGSSSKKYDVVIIDAHSRIEGENLGHSIGIETAKYCSNHGLSVLLVTSSFSHMLKQQRAYKPGIVDTVSGYDLLLLKSASYRSHVGLGRLLWHVTFVIALFLNFRALRDAGVISVSTPMPFLDLVTPVLKRVSGASLVVQIRDLWPEHFQSVRDVKFRLVSLFFYKPFLFMRGVMLRTADATVSVSDRGRRLAESYSPRKVHKLIPNVTVESSDFKGSDLLPRSNFVSGDMKLVNYSGTFGEAYDVELLVDAVVKLERAGDSNIKLVLSGAGPKWQVISDKIRDLDCALIEIHGGLSWLEYRSLVFHSDLAVLPYKKGSGVDFPAKFFDYLVAGTPVLHSLDGELRNFTDQNQCGFYFEPGDLPDLANQLQSLLTSEYSPLSRAKAAACQLGGSFSKEVQLSKFYDIYSGRIFDDNKH